MLELAVLAQIHIKLGHPLHQLALVVFTLVVVAVVRVMTMVVDMVVLLAQAVRVRVVTT